MCTGCWQEYGSPKIVSDRVTKARDLIDAVYRHNSAGGGLHVLLDDWNIEDDTIEYCRTWLDDAGSVQAERECLEAMASLSLEERASALALHCRFITAPPAEERK